MSLAMTTVSYPVGFSGVNILKIQATTPVSLLQLSALL